LIIKNEFDKKSFELGFLFARTEQFSGGRVSNNPHSKSTFYVIAQTKNINFRILSISPLAI